MKHFFVQLSTLLTLLLLAGFSYAACTTGEFEWPVTGATGHEQGDVGPRTPPVPGASSFHRGLDIAVPIGTPVMAAGGGVVERTFYDNGGGGNVMIIRHPNGSRTRYLHLDSFVAEQGASVSQGQQIAVSGNTGIGSAHLHFEIESAGGNRAPMVNGEYWDKAAGLRGGEVVSAGDCITGLAAAGLTPGGRDTGESAPNDSDTTPGDSDTIPIVPEGNFDPLDLDLDKLLPTPQTWIDETLKILERFNLAKHVNSLGFTLLFAAFVYSLVNATYFYQSDQYFQLFGRLIIAAGLIWGSPNIAKGGLGMWTSIHNNLQGRVTSEAVTELEEHINTFSDRMTNLAFVYGAATAAGAILPESFESKVESVQNATKVMIIPLFIITVLMASIYAIFFLSIYVSMLMMLLAGILLPVVAAFLVLPGMISWFSRWLNMIILSLAIVLILPFMLHVIVTVGVSKPIESMNELSDSAYQQLELLSKPELQGLSIEEWVDFMERIGEATATVVSNLGKIMYRWIFGLVTLAISMFASIYLLQQIPGLLQGFLGGAAGSAAHAASGSRLALTGLALGKMLTGGSDRTPPQGQDKLAPGSKPGGNQSTNPGGARQLALPSPDQTPKKS